MAGRDGPTPDISSYSILLGHESEDVSDVPIFPGPRPGRWVRGLGPGCYQKNLVCPDAFSLFWAALSLDCLWYSRCRRVQVWHRVSSGIRGSLHSTQIPRSLSFSLLCCMLRRFRALRSGVWDRWRSYSRRVSCLASTSVGVGWARGFGALETWPETGFSRVVSYTWGIKK